MEYLQKLRDSKKHSISDGNSGELTTSKYCTPPPEVSHLPRGTRSMRLHRSKRFPRYFLVASAMLCPRSAMITLKNSIVRHVAPLIRRRRITIIFVGPCGTNSSILASRISSSSWHISRAETRELVSKLITREIGRDRDANRETDDRPTGDE